MARLMQVIQVDELRGKGISSEPTRNVACYFTPDGERLAEKDSWRDTRAAMLEGAASRIASLAVAGPVKGIKAVPAELIDDLVAILTGKE